MNIINSNFKFANTLTKRKSTKYIILHHRAGNGDVQSIHSQHLGQGWSGIGYNFYVRKDGKVYSGRPIDTVGAHAPDYNSVSIGVCFEGNFETEKMSDTQIKAGREVITYLKGKYPKAEIKKHKDFNATSCPGKNFPFDELTKTELTSVNDIVWELNHRGIITDKNKWLSKLKVDVYGYWLAFKGANLTVNAKKHNNISVPFSIVTELNKRGIITEKEKWLSLVEKDMDMYWLARKICNMTENAK